VWLLQFGVSMLTNDLVQRWAAVLVHQQQQQQQQQEQQEQGY
jgi:hypothetical protein